MNYAATLKAMGFDDERIAEALGKDAEPKKRKNPYAPYKNKWERLFADVVEGQKRNGEILDWKYEPFSMVYSRDPATGKCLRYKPDFVVWPVEGRIQVYEVKGFLRPEARIRYLSTKAAYPLWNFTMIAYNKGRWVEMTP